MQIQLGAISNLGVTALVTEHSNRSQFATYLYTVTRGATLIDLYLIWHFNKILPLGQTLT